MGIINKQNDNNMSENFENMAQFMCPHCEHKPKFRFMYRLRYHMHKQHGIRYIPNEDFHKYIVENQNDLLDLIISDKCQ